METTLHFVGHLIVVIYTFVTLELPNSHWLRGAILVARKIGDWAGVTSLLVGPWLALLIIGLGAKHWLGFARSIAVVSGAGVPMVVVYAVGMTTSRIDSERGAWTAATFDLAFMPIFATPLLMIAAIVVLILIVRKKRRRPDSRMAL